jgi:hypothetical protein
VKFSSLVEVIEFFLKNVLALSMNIIIIDLDLEATNGGGRN